MKIRSILNRVGLERRGAYGGRVNMDATVLQERVLKALDNGAVGTVGEIRAMTAGAGAASLAEIEIALVDLEDDGLATLNGGVWRSATHGAHLATAGEGHGAQIRKLVFIPSLDQTTYLHLSYKADAGWFRIRRYESGRPVTFVHVPEAENDIVKLRRLHPVADERDWSGPGAPTVRAVEVWAQEIAKLNKGLPLP